MLTESALLSKEIVASIGDLSSIQQDFNIRHREGNRTRSNGSSPLHSHPLSIDHPSTYVNEIKSILAEERGLGPRNRDFVLEVLDRLAERVTSAEMSRNVVVGELVTLRERFQVNSRKKYSPKILHPMPCL